MDISVIIPYYKGEKYLDGLLDILDKNNQHNKYKIEDRLVFFFKFLKIVT